MNAREQDPSATRLMAGERLQALLAKYDGAVPRYTSYPPIPYWGAVDGETVRGWLAAPHPQPDAPLSLYTHIPFCQSRCYYCGCFVVITPHQEPAERYLQAVHQEMEQLAASMGAGRTERAVRQYHLGGGTPNFIAPVAMEQLVAKARSLFRFEPDAEMSIELDPRHLAPEDLAQLRALGFNRLSLGIQDFDEQVGRGVNRSVGPEHVESLVRAARAQGFLSVNFDLIYGLPHQTRERFARTMESVLEIGPDRLAVYNFAYLPQAFPHQRKMEAAALPSPDEKLAMFLAARERLMQSGYDAIGLDHYALHDDDLAVAYGAGTLRRNFMGYTTQAGTDLLAFGISAISEYDGRFWQNEKKLAAYLREVQGGRIPAVRGMALDAEDRLRQAVVADLFCRAGVNLPELGARFGLDARAHFASELQALEPLQADGLVRLSADGIEVTETGQFFLRNIALCFDHRTRQGAPVSFSRTA